MFNWPWRKSRGKELYPDEIFLDSRNLPSFNKQQFEGQIEKPISKSAVSFAGLCFLLAGLIFLGRAGFLQVVNGQTLAERSDQNKLRHTMIFSDRGIIYDRNGEELSWNNPNRVYTKEPGFAHILGYVGYPTEKDLEEKSFHPKSLIGKEGAERIYNSVLAGVSGIRIEEVNARGEISSDHVLAEPEDGESLSLTIDARIQSAFYNIIKTVAEENTYQGGAGVMMDINTGEIISLVSYPEYDPTVMSNATTTNREIINGYLNNDANPFLNRAVAGLYTPGSIVKPFMALAALNEGIISPTKQIVSTGKLVLPNPYNPDQPTIFKDWKAHGATDMRRAIAVSSDVYFYQIGGGFQNQEGLGILRIEKYMRDFGFGSLTGIALPGELEGVIPSPDWKEKTFDGEPWRLGNTYHTAIGQYGFLVSPIQAVRAISALGNGGKLVRPILTTEEIGKTPVEDLGFRQDHLQIIKDGMRLAVKEGTAMAINVPYVDIAAKSGTAEVGVNKGYINAWLTGFFPYENPRYAFIVVMERGRSGTLAGGGVVMRRLFDFMNQNTPEYFEVK